MKKLLQCDAPIGINIVLSEDLLDPANSPAVEVLIDNVQTRLRRLAEDRDTIREHVSTALDHMLEAIKNVRPHLVQKRGEH